MSLMMPPSAEPAQASEVCVSPSGRFTTRFQREALEDAAKWMRMRRVTPVRSQARA